MTHSLASAPGKLFLLGEYAVLEGAPALVCCVGQRAVARIQLDDTSGDAHSDLLVKVMAGKESSEQPATKVPLLMAAISELQERELLGTEDLTSGQIWLDTRNFHYKEDKLGLGSSAALTVALLAALLRQAGQRDFLDICMATHRRFQGGLGSGADIAAAVSGGCIAFNRGEIPEKITLPKNLYLRFVWTGSPGVTTSYLNKLFEWRDGDPHSYDAQMKRLIDLASEGRMAFKKDKAVTFIDIVKDYNEELQQLSHKGGLLFYNAAHRQLLAIAEEAGCVYKPSGAGGGDFGVAMSTSEQNINRLDNLMKEKGYMTSLIQLSGRGVELEIRKNNG